jgi:hypothetical protein
MSLILSKLERVRDLADGGIMARCPACAETGQDKRGEHLRLYPDGKFGCCVFPGDREHRKRIFALAGDSRPRVIRVKIAGATPKAAPPTPAQPDLFGRLGRVFDTPAEEAHDQAGAGTARTGSRNSAEAFTHSAGGTASPRASLGTLGTTYQKPLMCTEKNAYSTKGFDLNVPGVPRKQGGAKHPHLTPGGTLVIPFDSPERYHWWKGGQSVAATRAEVLARLEAEKEQHGTPV